MPLLALLSAAASAAQLDLALRTDVPVMVGASATVEGAHRLRGRLSGGFMPGPYVDLTNAAMTGFGVYSTTVADIIELALRRSLVLRVEGGWRPIEGRGLTLGGGYQLLGLGGDSTDLSLFGEAMDPRLLDSAQGVTGDLEVGVAAHMLTVEVGYEWVVKDHLVLTASLGFAGTVAAGARAEATKELSGPLEGEIRDAAVAGAADYLDYVFEEWVHLPMIGVSAGWRLP
jgi:hypothetical protein